MPGLMPDLLNVLVLAIVLLGAVRSLRHLRIWDLYIGFYFAGIVAFRSPGMGIVQYRFLIPLIPFLYYYLLKGLIWTASLLSRHDDSWAKLAVAMMVTLTVLFSLGANLQSWRELVRTRMTDLTVGTRWISENTSPESTVLARNPIARYLYAQCKTLDYPPPKQELEVGEYIETLGVD